MFFLKTLNKDASLSKACVAFVLHPEHLNLLSHTNSIELHIDITCEYCDVISFFRPGFLLEEPLCKASFPFVAGKVQQPGQIALLTGLKLDSGEMLQGRNKKRSLDRLQLL
jgi:hypothetical protein